MDFKIGDEIITVKDLWHNGSNIGERLGKIISITGYIVINLYEYKDNPIKCFRYEITKEIILKKHLDIFDKDDEIDFALDDPDIFS